MRISNTAQQANKNTGEDAMTKHNAVVVEDMTKYAYLHTFLRWATCLIGFALGLTMKNDMQVTVAMLVTCIFMLIVDIRVLSFSNLLATYGKVTKITGNDSRQRITVAYKPYLKHTTTYETEPDHTVFITAQSKIKVGQVVLVEYQRGNTWVAVGGKLHIAAELIVNVSSMFMVAHFITLLTALFK